MAYRKESIQKYFNNTGSYLNDNMVITMRSLLIAGSLEKTEGKELLDIGCGSGEITIPYLENNKVTFLDISVNMLDIVTKKIPGRFIHNAELVNQDLETFEPGRKYDCLFMLGVLAHVESIELAISRMSRLRKEDGVIIIQYTNSANLVSFILRLISYAKNFLGKKYGYKINFFSSGRLNRILKDNNLKVIKKISYWPSLPGFKLLNRKTREYIYFKILNNRILRSIGCETILLLKALKND